MTAPPEITFPHAVEVGFDGVYGLVIDGLDEDGTMHGHVDITDRHLQPFGIVHGGVLAAMAESMTSAGISWSRFASRTWPCAISRPSWLTESRCHSCCVRPRWIGVAVTVMVSPFLAWRRKSVELFVPTTTPFVPSQIWPAMLAVDSCTAQ